MAESKTYVFGEGGQSGFDPNVLLAGMMNGGGFGRREDMGRRRGVKYTGRYSRYRRR